MDLNDIEVREGIPLGNCFCLYLDSESWKTLPGPFQIGPRLFERSL